MIFESVAIIWKGASDPDEKRGGLYGGNWFCCFCGKIMGGVHGGGRGEGGVPPPNILFNILGK